jgi:hypothetical protein
LFGQDADKRRRSDDNLMDPSLVVA